MAFLPSLMRLLPPQVLLLGIVSKIHHLQALLSGNPGRPAAEMDVLGSASEEMPHSPGFGWGLGRGMKAVRAGIRASALGNRPQAAGETVKIKGYIGKRKGGGMGPRTGEGPQRPPWRPPLLSSLVSLRPRPLAEILIHSLSGSHPTSHSSKSSSLMQKCNPLSLLGTGVAKSEAFSKNLKSCFDQLKKITKVPLQWT